MAKTYEQLLAEINTLQIQADRLKKERGTAIGQANEIIRRHGLTAAELRLVRKANGKGAVKKRATYKVAPKYRSPNGVTWSGRGITPVWMRKALAKGKKKDDFLIKRS